MDDWNDDQLLRLQKNGKGRLENDPFFADISVMLMREGVDAAMVEKAIGPNRKKAGKTGACAIVQQPRYVERDGEGPGPSLKLMLSVVVIEARKQNNLGSVGTGKSAELIADNTLNLLHRFGCGSLGTTIMAAEKNPMTEYDTGRGDWVGYSCNFEMMRTLSRTTKVATPSVSGLGGVLTLTCATEGAEIYYTLDDTFPGPANSNAVLYAAPFNPGAATVIRIVAYISGSIPSDEVALDIA